MQKLKIINKLIWLTKKCLTRTYKKGFRQLSITLFICILEKPVRKPSIGRSVWNRYSRILAYAHDVELLSKKKSERLFKCFIEDAVAQSLKINELKTKYMVTLRNKEKHNDTQSIKINR